MKIISGGQTGVDRAALDVAMEVGMDYGGSIPLGRKAEDGPIDVKYEKLTELEAADYKTRTEKNVADADATLVLTTGRPTEGTAYTIRCSMKEGKPLLVIHLTNKRNDEKSLQQIIAWLKQTGPSTLNVAGPRESRSPGIYRRTGDILRKVLREAMIPANHA